MTSIAAPGASLPGVVHHAAALADVHLHYVSAGAEGPPILLVHG